VFATGVIDVITAECRWSGNCIRRNSGTHRSARTCQGNQESQANADEPGRPRTHRGGSTKTLGRPL